MSVGTGLASVACPALQQLAHIQAGCAQNRAELNTPELQAARVAFLAPKSATERLRIEDEATINLCYANSNVARVSPANAEAYSSACQREADREQARGNQQRAAEFRHESVDIAARAAYREQCIRTATDQLASAAQQRARLGAQIDAFVDFMGNPVSSPNAGAPRQQSLTTQAPAAAHTFAAAPACADGQHSYCPPSAAAQAPAAAAWNCDWADGLRGRTMIDLPSPPLPRTPGREHILEGTPRHITVPLDGETSHHVMSKWTGFEGAPYGDGPAFKFRSPKEMITRLQPPMQEHISKLRNDGFPCGPFQTDPNSLKRHLHTYAISGAPGRGRHGIKITTSIKASDTHAQIRFGCCQDKCRYALTYELTSEGWMLRDANEDGPQS